MKLWKLISVEAVLMRNMGVALERRTTQVTTRISMKTAKSNTL
jgi:hypothetical protein